MAQEVRPAHIQGKITDFKGGNVILFNYETRERDTISVDENGCFDHTIFQDKLTHMSLFFDAYGCDANLFIENGMEADLGISFTKEETYGMTFFVMHGHILIRMRLPPSARSQHRY